MKSNFFLLALAILILSQCTPPKQEIANNGKSDYKIVIPDSDDTLLQYAGRELQHYLKKTTGATLPLETSSTPPHGKAFAIGWPCSETENQPHTLHFSTGNNRVNITGGSSQSTLFAVYTFLEKYSGIRFYSPRVEVTPQTKVLKIPGNLNYTYTPEITTRTVHSRLFYDYPAFANKLKVTHEAFPGYVPQARVHTFQRFVPQEKYFKTHPEYYALRNGKRRPTQLCLSNPEVYQLVKKAVDNLLNQHPDARVISVSQNDNTQYCQCPECSIIDKSEGSPSGSMIKFVNRLARDFPNKEISTLAYQYTRKAPAHIRPEKNVLITLCSIECDRSAPISEKCKDFTHDLEAWGKLTNHIRIWDYTTQFTNFLAPFPNLHTLQPNIQLFRDNHAQWVFEQHSHHPSELFELRSYLTAKLLWEPDANTDSLTNDFLDGYYHEAAPYINQYITSIHQALKNDKDFFLFLYGDPSQAFDSYLKPQLLSQYNEWYNQAEKAVNHKPEVLKRVKVARISVDFALLEAARKQTSHDISLAHKNKKGKYVTNRVTLNRLNNFSNTCSLNNIRLLNEMGYKIEDYVSQYRATLQRAQKNNLAKNKPVTLLTHPKKYAAEDPQALTDGAFGGLNFYANWLGFEGNHLEAVIDLQKPESVSEISTAFLQVINHLVFFPGEVNFLTSLDGVNYTPFGHVKNEIPLTQKSKINDIRTFSLKRNPVKARYIKIRGQNILTPPVWHHGTGLPAWIFIDEVMVR